ncbi:MAG: hypothetical protein P9M08_08670 [Candidatus Erginobacter occultus]|nr:hypothetical protein [Candidatus Erginobacter occultus]
MIDSENQAAGLPQFAPLLGKITSPVQADIVAYFQENPLEGIDAAELAGKLKLEEIKPVEKALEDLEAAGLLSSEIEGVVQTKHYRYAPEVSLKRALDRIFGDKSTRDSWKDFRAGLAVQSRRKAGKRKFLLLAVSIIVVLGLGVGVYFIVGNIRDSGRQPVKVDLSEFSGLHETRYPGGQIKSRIEYSAGRRDGSFSAWFENGQKMAEGSYRDNRPQGRWIYWNEKGEPYIMISYQDGRAVSQ